MKIHITKQGESIETITSKYAVSKQDLTGINPHVNLSSELVAGLKLKIPDTNRLAPNPHIENFYPNLEFEQNLKEQSVPIGLKPLEATPVSELPAQELPNQQPTGNSAKSIPNPPPWAHLGDNFTHLNPHPEQQFPWNPSFLSNSATDTRLAMTSPYFLPYPPYPYPAYGYGLPYGFGVPFPIFGFGPGYGNPYGWYGGGFHGGNFHGGGFHGGGHHR